MYCYTNLLLLHKDATNFIIRNTNWNILIIWNKIIKIPCTTVINKKRILCCVFSIFDMFAYMQYIVNSIVRDVCLKNMICIMRKSRRYLEIFYLSKNILQKSRLSTSVMFWFVLIIFCSTEYNVTPFHT